MDISDLSVPQSSNISNVIRMDSSHTSLLFLYIHINTVGWWTTISVRTSENGGAQIFLCFFHSSSSVTTILLPKKVRTVYCSTGLGNRARWSATSCKLDFVSAIRISGEGDPDSNFYRHRIRKKVAGSYRRNQPYLREGMYFMKSRSCKRSRSLQSWLHPSPSQHMLEKTWFNNILQCRHYYIRTVMFAFHRPITPKRYTRNTG